MKRLVLTVVACFISIGVWAQVPVPYIFVPNTPASANQVNADFQALSDNALNRSGNGEITGNIKVLPGITIDGVDIGKMLGGDGSTCTNCILTGNGSFISTALPQLVVGYDDAHLWQTHVDQNGNVVFQLTAAGTGFHFAKLIVASGGIRLPAGATFDCTGCIGPTQLLESGVVTGTYGSIGAVPVFTVDSDGRLTSVTNVPISIEESAIIDATPSILARVGGNETITGSWTFTNPPTMSGAGIAAGSIPESALAAGATYTQATVAETISAPWTFNGGIVLNFPADIRLYGAGEGGVIKQSSACGVNFPGLWLGSRENGADHLVLCLTDSLLTAYGNIRPSEDARWSLGDPTHRFTTAHFALQRNMAPNLVITNVGGPIDPGGNPQRNTALGYFVGYPGIVGDEAYTSIKQLGACAVHIRAGLIIDVTGCGPP